MTAAFEFPNLIIQLSKLSVVNDATVLDKPLKQHAKADHHLRRFRFEPFASLHAAG